MKLQENQLQTNRGFLLSIMIAFSFFFSAGNCNGEEFGALRLITEEFPPYNYTTDDGAIVGITTEIVREILRRIGHPDNIEVMPWADGYRLARGEDNIVLFSTTRSPMREKLFKWVGPLVPNNLAFFARKGSGISIAGLEDAKQVKAIGVYKDDYGELLLKDKGFSNLDAVVENSQNIPRLLQGEIDLWIANEITAKHMIAESGAGRRIVKVFDVQKDYMSIAFSRTTPDAVIDHWQRVLDEIKSDGTYAQIFSQWIMFSYTDDLKPKKGRKLMLTTEERAWLQAHPVIRVAADPDYAPFQFNNEMGDSEGMANDFLELVAQKLGIRFDYLISDTWAQALDLVKTRKADMLAEAAETPERLKYLRFTVPYVEFSDVIITRTGQTIASLEALSGKRLATLDGTAINEFLQRKYPQIELVTVADVRRQLQLVSTGEVDAAVMNLATTSYAIAKWNIANLHINDVVDYSYKLAFASRRDWPMLNHLLEKALGSITEAERQQIQRKWINVSQQQGTSEKKEIELTEEERQWLAEHPVILGASDPDWPPMERMDHNGKFIGMVADYMALVAQRLGFQLQMVPQKSWTQALRSVRERDVALLTAAARTPDREKYLRYTEPYLELPAVIIVNDKSRNISGMADLADKRVSVVKDYGTHDYLSRHFPDLELALVADIRSGLYAVSHGKVDAFIANIASASYYIEKYAIQNLKVAGESGYRYELGVASRRDWPILNRILQKGVASITPEEQQTIYRKWIGLKPEAWKPTREQLITFAVILIVIGFGATLFWNRQLRRKVDVRTRELQASEEKAMRAREAAEQASRAKSDFLATMSHEMRTPMNAVLGLTHLALHQELSVQQRGYLNSIQLAARSLLGVINDVLDLSKVEAGRLELEQIEFDLDQVLENSGVVAGHEALSKGLGFAIHVQKDVPHRFVGDSQRLGQILLNLTGNAVKFTERGSVEIAVSIQEISDERACLRFEVRDTGIGMSEAQTTTIFDAFTQGDSSTTRRYGGTGLGLNIANLLTQMMGGRLTVQSTPGRGSTFVFSAWLGLPSQAPRQAHEGLALVGSRLLVCSSDSIARHALSDLLERAGGSVMAVDDAGAMIRSSSDGSPPYDLVVFDARAERGDGWARLQPTIPATARVLILSRQEFADCSDSRVTCIQTPVTPLTLVRASARILGVAHTGSQDELPSQSRAKLAGRRVLLVEDNPINQEVGQGLLAATGVDVRVVESGKAALEMVEAEEFDLVLMDIQMPDMSGYEVTEILRRDPRFEKIPVVAMTAHALKDARDAAAAAGMDDFLTKPIDPERFYAVVAKYLELPESETDGNPTKEQTDPIGDLPGIDTADGLRRASGNVALYMKLLREFKQRHGEDAKRITSLLEQGDEKKACRLVHSLKGAAGNLGARSLCLTCGQVEESIDNGYEVNELDVLQFELDQVLTTISQLPENPHAQETETDQQIPAWSELVAELSTLLTQGNMRAIDKVSAVRYHAAEKYSDLVNEFEERVECYHFDDAIRVLDQLDSVVEGKS